MLMSALVKKTNPLSEIKDIQSQNKYLRINHQTVIINFSIYYIFIYTLKMSIKQRKENHRVMEDTWKKFSCIWVFKYTS